MWKVSSADDTVTASAQFPSEPSLKTVASNSIVSL